VIEIIEKEIKVRIMLVYITELCKIYKVAASAI